MEPLILTMLLPVSSAVYCSQITNIRQGWKWKVMTNALAYHTPVLRKELYSTGPGTFNIIKGKEDL
jgi:hypothetical protein